MVKQADLVMALFYAGEYFTPEEKARNFAFYERLTVRDSSLSVSIEAAVAAEVGHMELAYDYFAEAALLDLDDLQHNTRDGIHIASLAAACTAAIAGFGGLRDLGGKLSFVPRLPQVLTRLALNLRARETTRLRIEVEQTQATYTLLMGERLDIHHHGKPITVTASRPVQRPIPPANPAQAPDPAAQPRAAAPAPADRARIAEFVRLRRRRDRDRALSAPVRRGLGRSIERTARRRTLPGRSRRLRRRRRGQSAAPVGRTRQVEHCNNGQKQGRAVARSMLGSTGRSLDWPFGASRCPRRPGSSWRMPAPSRTPPLTRIGSSGPTPTRPGARAAKSSRFQPRPTAPAIDFCPRTATTKSGLTFCVSIDGQGVALMIETRPPGPDNILYWRNCTGLTRTPSTARYAQRLWNWLSSYHDLIRSGTPTGGR